MTVSFAEQLQREHQVPREAGDAPEEQRRSEERQAGHRGQLLEEVARRDPQMVLASWCGRKVKTEKIIARPGWSGVSAVKNGHLYEIRSPIILQPGPALFTDGAEEVARLIRKVALST